MKQFEITSENSGQRFDKYLLRILSKANMSFIYKMLRKKNFVLNDCKATGKEILKEKDVIKLYLSDETFEKFKSDTDSILVASSIDSDMKKNFDIESRIVYEDKDIIIINKPEGILSQKAKAFDISVNEYILDYLIDKNHISKEDLINYKPSVVNRLDRNTTGLIIAAKNLRAAQYLSKAIHDRRIKKYYKCIVCGNFDKAATYKAYLTKDIRSNKVLITEYPLNAASEYIETAYELLNSDGSLSTLKVHLITGKSHQIRAHLSFLGYPILGDRKYGNQAINKKYRAENQLLHAYRLEFPDDSEGQEFDFINKVIECEAEFRY